MLSDAAGLENALTLTVRLLARGHVLHPGAGWLPHRKPSAGQKTPQARTLMLYETIEVRKLNPVIGAEIFGVDLSKDLSNQQLQEVLAQPDGRVRRKETHCRTYRCCQNYS